MRALLWVGLSLMAFACGEKAPTGAAKAGAVPAAAGQDEAEVAEQAVAAAKTEITSANAQAEADRLEAQIANDAD
jgi:hypothetical protein